MPEYISQETLKQALTDKFKSRIGASRVPTWNDAFDAVTNIPSATDVVEVVRCRECRYHYKTYSGWFCSHGVFVNDAVPLDDFYCGYGKRKDGGQDDV